MVEYGKYSNDLYELQVSDATAGSGVTDANYHRWQLMV